MMEKILVQNLSFAYGQKPVLKNINWDLSPGFYGLLGRNGAGKTTLMRAIVGLLPVKTGQIVVCGETAPRARQKKIGYLPQDFDFYPEMSVREALLYLGSLDLLKGSSLKRRVDELLELVHLSQDAKKKIRSLSGGMKRRLGIAQTLLNDPPVLIVDEPTAGLDPEERIRFRNLLGDLAQDKIVLFSTHIASDLESAAPLIAILEQGRFIYRGSVQALLEEYGGGTYEAVIDPREVPAFKREYIVFEQRETPEGLSLHFIHRGRPRPDFKRIPPSLESAYLMKIHEKQD